MVEIASHEERRKVDQLERRLDKKISTFLFISVVSVLISLIFSAFVYTHLVETKQANLATKQDIQTLKQDLIREFQFYRRDKGEVK